MNAQNIMMKNALDSVISALCFFVVGYGLAYGAGNTGFVGTTGFALVGVEDLAHWFLQFAFATNSTTIFGGSVVRPSRAPPP